MIPITVKSPARLATRQNGGSKLLRVEDTSWRLQYDGQWSSSSVPVDQDHDDDLSVHVSSQSGSTIKFAFNGTFVGVYGVLDDASYDATFTLDDEPPTRQAITEPPHTSQINWPFFSTSTPLEPGLHELTMTLNQGTFMLDYIQYTSTNGLDDVGDASQVQASPDGAAPSGIDLQQSGVGAKLSTGAVAGIAVAAAVIVLGVVALLLRVFYRRARRVRHQRSSPEKPLDILHETSPKSPPPAARGPLRRLSRIYRPRAPRSAQSSKTATSSAPTSVTQSSAMFTSVIMLSPALSMVSEEGDGHSRV